MQNEERLRKLNVSTKTCFLNHNTLNYRSLKCYSHLFGAEKSFRMTNSCMHSPQKGEGNFSFHAECLSIYVILYSNAKQRDCGRNQSGTKGRVKTPFVLIAVSTGQCLTARQTQTINLPSCAVLEARAIFTFHCDAFVYTVSQGIVDHEHNIYFIFKQLRDRDLTQLIQQRVRDDQTFIRNG